MLSWTAGVPVVIDATRRAAAAIPGAEIRQLVGHAHFAHRTDPQLVHGIIRDLIAS